MRAEHEAEAHFYEQQRIAQATVAEEKARQRADERAAAQAAAQAAAAAQATPAAAVWPGAPPSQGIATQPYDTAGIAASYGMEPQRAATELSQTLSLGSGGGYAGMPTASAPAEYYGAQAVAEDVVLPIVGAPYAGPPAAAAPSRSGSLAGRTAPP